MSRETRKEDQSKLYRLSWFKDEHTAPLFLSYSHSIGKLIDSTTDRGKMWDECSANYDNHVVRMSDRNNYPRYEIKEVNFIV